MIVAFSGKRNFMFLYCFTSVCGVIGNGGPLDPGGYAAAVS